ncbi:MAG: hypothetical protein JSS09_09395 [Verrucomicrobia bacterium]|nr:hypothetical protein [Verrucomicrobiota bacterium]
MVFIYLLILGAVFFSWKGKKKVSKLVWLLAFAAGFLTWGLFIYHGLSPLEIKI